MSKSTPTPSKESQYISPNELSKRWQCSRSSVDRIARRAGLTRVCLGKGRNGMIRYLRQEILTYESARTIQLTPHFTKG